MEEQIKADNEVRQEWNRAVDRAIVSGVSEEDISRIKKNEITEKVRYSIDLYGDRPDLLASIIKLAIAVLVEQVYHGWRGQGFWILLSKQVR